MEGEGRSVEDTKSEPKEVFGMSVMEGNDCVTATSLKRTLRRSGQSSSMADFSTSTFTYFRMGIQFLFFFRNKYRISIK